MAKKAAAKVERTKLAAKAPAKVALVKTPPPRQTWTYLLKAETSELNLFAPALREKCEALIAVRGGMAVAAVDKTHAERFIPQSWIQDEVEGDQFKAFCGRFLNRTRLDELHMEFLARSPVTGRDQAQAVALWKKAREGVATAELAFEEARRAVELAKRAEYEASEHLVRVHGRAPIDIDGVTYDYNHMTKKDNTSFVYLIARRRRGGL